MSEPRSRILPYFFMGLAFVFPIGMGMVEHWSSGLFYLAVVVALLGLGLHEVWFETDEKYVFVAFAVFCFVSAISLVDALDIAEGIRRLEKLLSLLAAVPIYLLLRRRHLNLIRPFFLGATAAGPAMALIAYYYVHQQGLHRADGFYSSIVFGQTSMLISMLLLCGLYVGRCSMWYRYMGSFSLVCALYAALLSGTRGAWAVLPVVALFLSARYFSWRRIILMVSILFFFVGAMMINDPSRSRMARIDNHLIAFLMDQKVNTSVGARLELWTLAVEMWKEQPLLGVGIGNFKYQLQQYADEKRTQLRRNYTHAHNIFFDTLASSGSFGLVGMITALFVMPSWFFLRLLAGSVKDSTDFPAVSGLVVLLCFFVFGMTEGWLIHSAMVTQFTFALVVFISSAQNAKKTDHHAKRN